MTATGHALIGASIATQIPNPWIAIPLSFLSHFLIDKIPHWDPMTNKATKTKKQIYIETALDIIIGYILVAMIFLGWFQVADPILVFISAFAAQLPDFLEAPYLVFHTKIFPFYHDYKLQSWIHDIGFNARLSAPWGVVTQVVTVLIFLVWAAPK